MMDNKKSLTANKEEANNTCPKSIKELFKDYDGNDMQEEIDWGELQGEEVC